MASVPLAVECGNLVEPAAYASAVEGAFFDIGRGRAATTQDTRPSFLRSPVAEEVGGSDSIRDRDGPSGTGFVRGVVSLRY